MKKIILILIAIMFLSPSIAYAAACTSNGAGGGVWSNPATWAACGGGVPGAADSVQILAGDSVEIDSNISVGNVPASVATCNIDILGTLFWPSTVAGNYTFTARSSICVKATGVFRIGDSTATPLPANRLAYVYFDNTPANFKYYVNISAGGRFYMYGSPSYTSSTQIIRARIESCNPDCLTGAGRTITLDRTVNWTASASATHDAIIIGVGGGVTSQGANNPEIITTWTSPANNQIGNVTLTQDHQVGDIVANASRNILFESDSATYHSYISAASGGGADNAFNVSWIRLNEMGDSATTAAAIAFNAPNYALGKIDYVAATNCEDGAASGGFYVHALSLTSFSNNISHDARGGTGINIAGAAASAFSDCNNLTYIEGASTNSTGISLGSNLCKTLDGPWISHAAIGINPNSNSTPDIKNGLIHGNTSYAISTQAASTTHHRFNKQEISGNEIRNISGTYGFYILGGRYFIKNNTFLNVQSTCIQFNTQGGNSVMSGNKYDNCNYSNTAASSGLYIQELSYNIYAINEDFGSISPNLRSNISFGTISYSNTQDYPSRYACNNCKFVVPTNNLGCVGDDLSSLGIVLAGCLTAPTYNAYIQIADNTYKTFHNLNQVEGAHWGYGMGGMIIKRETATVVDNTLNVKIKPYNATDIAWHPIGTIQANAGQNITVKVQLRKNEAQAAGERPRIAVEGCGTDRYTNYSEMTDVINTWEEQTISFVSTYKGTVHIYLGAKNKLSGAGYYEPVSPPTFEVFADGMKVSN
jgi:hypothetical protein